jgi:hypothetical protein
VDWGVCQKFAYKGVVALTGWESIRTNVFFISFRAGPERAGNRSYEDVCLPVLMGECCIFNLFKIKKTSLRLYSPCRDVIFTGIYDTVMYIPLFVQGSQTLTFKLAPTPPRLLSLSSGLYSYLLP